MSRAAAARIERPYLQFSHTVPDWVRPEWASQVAVQDRWRSSRLPVRLETFWQRQRYLLLVLARRHVNVDNVLTFAATAGVELRHPFYDLRLTEFLIGAPGELFLRGSRRKHLLREAMRGVLPEVVRTRQTKAHFGAPVISAVLDGMAGREVDDLQAVRRGWLDRRRLDEILAAHRQWRARGAPHDLPREPLAALWSAMAMDVWLAHAVNE